ncbi:hypothetical protein B0T17DRAFT_514918 [Bombardia bombarda]|uniref:Uncharacterized protein n=1 Tax=Bombardia bombarda TaxID=252184 RepID=A0AA39XJX5_9PEZI|nr:hypothetical protein B0T17DRAFT_514918 [Bombardia bombarda]
MDGWLVLISLCLLARCLPSWGLIVTQQDMASMQAAGPDHDQAETKQDYIGEGAVYQQPLDRMITTIHALLSTITAVILIISYKVHCNPWT